MSNDPLPPDNDEIPPEIDFTGGTRGKFYRADARLHLPVYADIAAKKGVPLSDLANDLLKKEIAILEAIK